MPIDFDARKIEAHIRESANRIDANARDAARDAARDGATVARRNAPIRSGRLRRSIRTRNTPNGAAFGSSLPYARKVDRRSSRPGFMRKGARAAAASLRRRLGIR